MRVETKKDDQRQAHAGLGCPGRLGQVERVEPSHLPGQGQSGSGGEASTNDVARCARGERGEEQDSKVQSDSRQ